MYMYIHTTYKHTYVHQTLALAKRAYKQFLDLYCLQCLSEARKSKNTQCPQLLYKLCTRVANSKCVVEVPWTNATATYVCTYVYMIIYNLFRIIICECHLCPHSPVIALFQLGCWCHLIE